jgi:hypothetical protein
VLISSRKHCLMKLFKVVTNLLMKYIQVLGKRPINPTSYTKWINIWTWKLKKDVSKCISNILRTLSFFIIRPTSIQTHHTNLERQEMFSWITLIVKPVIAIISEYCSILEKPCNLKLMNWISLFMACLKSTPYNL